MGLVPPFYIYLYNIQNLTQLFIFLFLTVVILKKEASVQKNLDNYVIRGCSIDGWAYVNKKNSFKGSLTRDFRLQVFFMNQCPPGPQVFHWSLFEFFRKLAEIFVIHRRGVVDKKPKSIKFIAGVNNTAKMLFTGVNDTADKFFGGVSDIADKHSFANISANFRKNSKWS